MRDAPVEDDGSEELEGSLAELQLQAILASKSGNTALINGEAYRVGETVKNSEWTITAIDGRARSVTLKHEPTDRVDTIHVKRPGR